MFYVWQLRRYDPQGNRVDEILTCRAWGLLHDFSARRGLVAAGYERKEYGQWRCCF